MAERRHEIEVGIVFILATAVLIAGVLWFKEFRIGGQAYSVKVEFLNTSGLGSGDPVEVRGVSSGNVSEIVYESGRALVTLSLNRDVVITPGTEFAIENVGIMGQKLVAIYPGPPEGEPLPDDMVHRGSYQSGIPTLMADLGGALDSFERLAVRLETLLAAFDEAEQGTLTRILTNTEALTEDLARFLEDTRGDLSQSVGNLNDAMASIHDVLEGRDEQIDEALENTARASARLDSTLVGLQTTLARADRLLADIEEGEGTLGKMAQDPALYDDLRSTLNDAQVLINDIQENPRKYLKFSVF